MNARFAREREARPSLRRPPNEENDMPTITTRDGTQIFYNDWGHGQPVVFSHGWPLTSDAFEDQMMFLAEPRLSLHRPRPARPRPVEPAVGRQRHGSLTPTISPTCAAHLNLRDAVHVGHSTGGGEAARYVARHGAGRVAKAGADRRGAADHAEDGGQSRAACRSRSSTASARRVAADRSQFFKELQTSRSTASTGRARRSARACATRSGCRA